LDLANSECDTEEIDGYSVDNQFTREQQAKFSRDWASRVVEARKLRS